MILLLSDSLSRGLVVAAALLVGLWLSFFGIRAAIADVSPERLNRARSLVDGAALYDDPLQLIAHAQVDVVDI